MPDPLHDPAEIAPAPGLRTRFDALPSNLRGGLIFLVATVFFSIMVSMIKLAGQRLHVTEILFFRQMTMIVVSLPLILHGWPGSLQSRRPGLQVLRVGVAFMAMTLGFSAIIELPLAEATVISFSKTFFTTVLAIFLLGEIVRVPRWLALAMGFVGVLIIVWPQPGTEFNHWHLMALGSAVCVSLVMVLIRILARIDQPITILTYQSVGVGALMFIPMLYFWKTPTLFEAGLLIAIGVVSAIGQYLNILAMKAGEASAMAPLEYTRLIFTTALGFWLFSEWPDPRVWLGAAVIVAAALYTLHRERRARST